MNEKKEFRSESKRLLDLMVNSIYTNQEIFLRELISNASDALDKRYYLSLEDETMTFNKDDYYIEIIPNEEKRTLTILDTGIGMSEKDLEENLGTIAKSGTLDFKNTMKEKDQTQEIIGQFGVGFYSSFMVADKVTVLTKTIDEEKGHLWLSEGPDGYSIEEAEKENIGTTITLYLKENDDEEDAEDYTKFLNEYTLSQLVKKYSNYIRYPIRMEMTKTREIPGKTEEDESTFEEYKEWEQLNSMVPIWKKNKNELEKEDYINFYQDQHYGFDEPLTYIHSSVEGVLSYRSILFIPTAPPFDYFSKDYKRGLQLYSNGVLIMDRCEELLPEYYGFVKGVVDSEDISLNISREILQQNRQLRTIAKNLESKITVELKKMINNDRESYEKFFETFGVSLKMGIYESYGMKKEPLQDLLLFYSSKEKKHITLKEYTEKMISDQKSIYYATGSSLGQIDKLPQGESFKEKGYEILYLIDPIDEFVLKSINSFEEHPFQNVSQEIVDEKQNESEEIDDLFGKMKDFLNDEVVEVRGTDSLGDDPVCLLSRGDISIEMEKTFLSQANHTIVAQKVLEINKEHPIYKKLEAIKDDEEKLKEYTSLLYDQARLIEGLPIDDPVEYSKAVWKLLLK